MRIRKVKRGSVMGIIADMKAISAVQKIYGGEKAKLSISQITGLLVNLMDAQKNLSALEFEQLYAVFNQLRKDKKKTLMNYSVYLHTAVDIIKQFDLIAPYELYCGGESGEFAGLLKSIRKKKNSSSNMVCVAEKQYIEELVDKSNGVISDDDAKDFVHILTKFQGHNKEKIIDDFDDFIGSIVDKYGEIQSLAKVTFFIGVLNANGIISESEMNNMRDNFTRIIISNLSQ